MKTLSISDKLYLTMPIYADDEGDTIVAYIHSTPISREIFEAHFSIIGQAFSRIYAGGYGMMSGPRIASLILHDVARETGDPHSALALMNEIRRLTNAMIRTEHGWETFAFQDVVDRRLINEDDISEVMNSIVFFTVCSSMHRKRDRKTMLTNALRMWGASISSLDFTAFTASHGTSNNGGHTTQSRVPVSSVVF